jgi:tetratricopeptide (TPR) repeat protein
MDYQQVQKASPSPQLEQFIQKIQNSMAVPAAVPYGLPSQSGGDNASLFEKGKDLFAQKRYPEAVQILEAALRQGRPDYTLYYYLGLAYKATGNLKYSAAAVGIANQMKPDPSMASYVMNLKSRLSQRERAWVDEQLGISAGGKTPAFHTKPPGATDYALRLRTGVVFLDMPDLLAEGQAGQTYALQQQLSDPAVTYNADLPTLAANVAFEPVFNIAQNLELGFPIEAIPTAAFREKYVDSTGTITRSFGITGFALGVELRLVTGDGPFRIYFGGGPMIVPIVLNYNEMDNASPVSGSFTGVGLGAKVQFGFDIHLDNGFAFGPYIGYAFANVTSFDGTIVDNTNNINTSAKLYTLPDGTWPILKPIPEGQAVPVGAIPTQVNLGGLTPGFQFSAFF